MKKKMLVFMGLALVATTSFAQQMTVNAGRTTFGLRGGVNFYNINGKDGAGNDIDNDLNTGFHAGVNAEVPLGTGFYVQP
ncbi:MAG TPA: PorT family protein, partial [Chitinophagaceae bacterium]|nr:PorT family protein [Chitinophagaceae bacterium]